jgi:Fic family protein
MTEDWMARAARIEGVPSRLAAARDAVDALLRDRGHRRTARAVTMDALLRAAVASARLEGSTSTIDDIQAGSGDRIVVPIVRVAPLQAVARLHALAAAGHEPDAGLGRLREVPGLADDMQALGRTLVAPTEAPAIAVAGLIHALIATQRPFASMNAVVGRAMERLLLVARGVDPASVLVPEAGHLRLAAQYHDVLAGLEDASQDGPAKTRATGRYLLHTAAAVTLGVDESPLRAGS